MKNVSSQRPGLLITLLRVSSVAVSFLAILVLLGAAFVQAQGDASLTTGGRSAQAVRGQYLVEKVSMCVDCHSPRNDHGEFDRTRWLQGSPLAFAPTVPMPAWAPYAPGIAGLPGYTSDEAVKLLTTGATRHGLPLRPPMPAFRMSSDDAEAVVAYLQSLGQGKQ